MHWVGDEIFQLLPFICSSSVSKIKMSTQYTSFWSPHQNWLSQLLWIFDTLKTRYVVYLIHFNVKNSSYEVKLEKTNQKAKNLLSYDRLSCRLRFSHQTWTELPGNVATIWKYFTINHWFLKKLFKETNR